MKVFKERTRFKEIARLSIQKELYGLSDEEEQLLSRLHRQWDMEYYYSLFILWLFLLSGAICLVLPLVINN